MKICIECKKNPCDPGRRYCHDCLLSRIRRQYQARGGAKTHPRHGKGKCQLCNKEIKLGYKKQKYCLDCAKTINSLGGGGHNPYANAGGGGYCWLHRRIAEEILGRKLKTNEVVHHLDDDPKNNEKPNLVVMSRKNHGRLHWYLKEQRALFEKSNNEKGENCWKTLIVPMTTTWLETAGVKVIKLWEIGQSAAESLRNAKIL